MSKNVVELKQINKSFGGKEVLKGITMGVRDGEIFGLLGPSGAGKTTLIKILTGQLEASGGSALVFGKDSSQLKNNNYRDIGMMMDNSGIYDRLSCYDNLKLFASIFHLEKRTVENALKVVALENAAKTPAGRLSKGMKQRLVLARAIMHSPRLLFLDEPTSGLDPATARTIHELLDTLRKEGMTIFMTTHNMEEATKICGRVALLHEGDIVECGEPEMLCRKYNKENLITIMLKNNEVITLPNQPENSARIGDLMQQGSILSIHSSEPDLEQVFLTLTGRGLEE